MCWVIWTILPRENSQEVYVHTIGEQLSLRVGPHTIYYGVWVITLILGVQMAALKVAIIIATNLICVCYTSSGARQIALVQEKDTV